MREYIRAWNRLRKARRLANRKPVRTPWGFDFVGPKSMQEGQFEKTEVELLGNLLATADLFVNVGANYGYFSCLAQTHSVPVVAIEPVPRNLELLRRNVALNGFGEGVRIEECACGADTGTAEIYGVGTGASLVSGWAGNPGNLKTVVPVRRLDDIVAPDQVTPQTVFLIDVEGFEMEVLRGADAILRGSAKPRFMIESGLSDHRREEGLNAGFLEVFDTFDAAGFDMFGIDQQDSKVLREDIKASLTQGTDLVGSLNFLVTPRN